MTEIEALRRLSDARVGRLATADREGIPHIVPLVFVIADRVLYSPVDHKPKRTIDLRRLRNIRDNPRASVLVDHYEEDWGLVWWVRADGRAGIVKSGGSSSAAVDLLVAKYPQYGNHRPTGPVIRIDIERISGWKGEPQE